MSAYLENINISRGHALASTALVLSVLAILFAVSMRATPCVSAASGSCSVGETETFAGTLGLGKDADIEYEGATENDFETTLTVTDPTADRTITFPDASGTVALSGGGAATVPEGGTGVTTLAANGVLVGDGANAVNVTAAGNAGEVLTSNGAGSDPTFQSASAAAYIDQWRITWDSNNSQTPIQYGWERSDSTGFSGVGTGMTHEGSGVFKFPVTGVWSVRAMFFHYADASADLWQEGRIVVTDDNGTGSWDTASMCMMSTYSTNAQGSCFAEVVFNVTDVDLDKVQFHLTNVSTGNRSGGDTSWTETGAVFQWVGNP